jgi:ketosteroid isomerase-like protein
MGSHLHEHYIKLVEQDYFGNVARQDVAGILACFTEDARVTIYHGDNEPRRFSGAADDGAAPLRSFFDHLLANYDPHFEDFSHFVDAENDRCAAYFKVRLTPKPDSPYVASGVLNLCNCNFFLYRDGKIHDMTLYYANPEAAKMAGPAPTGFPKAS